MRKVLFFMVTAATLAACSENKKEQLSAGPDNTRVTDSLRRAVLPTLAGDWVLTDYIDEIERTLSPLQAAKKLGGIVEMIIPGSSSSDSLKVSISLNNHEGSDFMAYLRPGKTGNSIKTNIVEPGRKTDYFELGFETLKNRVFLFLYRYDQSGTLLNKRCYSKAGTAGNNIGAGLNQIVNQRVASGSYLLIDSLNITRPVTFLGDGTVTGFREFKKYEMVTDYWGSPEKLDKIGMDDLIAPRYFAFIKKGDTVKLFSMMEKADGTDAIDKLVYRMVKQ